jgi:hypothetical protein
MYPHTVDGTTLLTMEPANESLLLTLSILKSKTLLPCSEKRFIWNSPGFSSIVSGGLFLALRRSLLANPKFWMLKAMWSLLQHLPTMTNWRGGRSKLRELVEPSRLPSHIQGL